MLFSYIIEHSFLLIALSSVDHLILFWGRTWAIHWQEIHPAFGRRTAPELESAGFVVPCEASPQQTRVCPLRLWFRFHSSGLGYKTKSDNILFFSRKEALGKFSRADPQQYNQTSRHTQTESAVRRALRLQGAPGPAGPNGHGPATVRKGGGAVDTWGSYQNLGWTFLLRYLSFCLPSSQVAAGHSSEGNIICAQWGTANPQTLARWAVCFTFRN